MFATFLGLDKASRAAILFARCNETLLWIVGDISGDNREHEAIEAISTGHLDALGSRFLQRLQHCAHTIMEQLIALNGPPIFGETLKLRNGNVAKKYHCPRGCLATSRLLDISDADIDWPCLLVATETREVGLVG